MLFAAAKLLVIQIVISFPILARKSLCTHDESRFNTMIHQETKDKKWLRAHVRKQYDKLQPHMSSPGFHEEVRRRLARSRKVSRPRDWMIFFHCKIWQAASWQHYWWDTFEMAEQLENDRPKYHDFETSRDLKIRRLTQRNEWRFCRQFSAVLHRHKTNANTLSGYNFKSFEYSQDWHFNAI